MDPPGAEFPKWTIVKERLSFRTILYYHSSSQWFPVAIHILNLNNSNIPKRLRLQKHTPCSARWGAPSFLNKSQFFAGENASASQASWACFQVKYDQNSKLPSLPVTNWA